MSLLQRITFSILLMNFPPIVYSQGCSDAGFCSLKYTSTYKEAKMNIGVGNVIGIGEAGVIVNNTYISYGKKLTSNTNFDLKINANYASGQLGSVFNIGDVIANIAYKVYNNEMGTALHLVGGVKVPLSQSNNKASIKSLPMAYQASLGTWDALFGVNIVKNKWEFTNAYQIPFINNNKNTFVRELSSSTDFPTTNQFLRKPDALLRIAYHIKKGKWFIKPNLLAIQHLGKDSYEDILGKRQIIEGSQGLTLNGNIIANHFINKKNSIEFSLASPFIVRKVRPDGLTRSVTFGLEYKFTF